MSKFYYILVDDSTGNGSGKSDLGNVVVVRCDKEALTEDEMRTLLGTRSKRELRLADMGRVFRQNVDDAHSVTGKKEKQFKRVKYGLDGNEETILLYDGKLHCSVNVVSRPFDDNRGREGRYMCWNGGIDKFLKAVGSDYSTDTGNSVITGREEHVLSEANQYVYTFFGLSEDMKDKVLADMNDAILTIKTCDFIDGWTIDDYLDGEKKETRVRELTEEERKAVYEFERMYRKVLMNFPHLDFNGETVTVNGKNGMHRVYRVSDVFDEEEENAKAKAEK